MRAIIVLALAAILAACGSNPSPPSTHPGTIASVYSCAVSVMEGERYELMTERRETEPDAWIAVFAKPGVNAYVIVAQSGVGHVFVEVRDNRLGRTWVRDEGLTSMIERQCTQTR